MNHENINKFIGVVTDAPHVSVLMLYAQKGSLQVNYFLSSYLVYDLHYSQTFFLQDVLQNEAVNLTWDFKMSLATDISKVCILQIHLDYQ